MKPAGETTRKSQPPDRAPVEKLETGMRKVSLAVSLLGLGLMSSGLIDMLAGKGAYSLPGAGVVPLGRLINFPFGSVGVMLASVGIILLGLLPAIRVIMALLLYLRAKDLFSTAIAVIVLLELIFSIRMSL